MQAITAIGLDIAKSVFQVHGVDAQGSVVVRQQLKRARVLPFFKKLGPCVVGIEACASSHYWAREITALGHEVKLMPPAYVKPYVKRQKNDAKDAEAICEAVQRPSMQFVPAKTPEQQAGLMLHRTRHLLIRQQTAVINSIRAHMAEFGIVANVGRMGVDQLLRIASDPGDTRIPEVARGCMMTLGQQLQLLKAQLLDLDRRIIAWHRSSETSKQLDALPGVGPALATALVATVADPKAFRSGRDFSAWIGTRSQTEFERRQSEARRHQPTRRSLFAFALLYGRACRYPLREDSRHHASAMARELACPATSKGRCNRARQQARQNGLGHDGQRRMLSRTHCPGAISPDQSDKVRPATASKNGWKGRTARHAEPVDPVIRTPKCPHAFSNACC